MHSDSHHRVHENTHTHIHNADQAEIYANVLEESHAYAYGPQMDTVALLDEIKDHLDLTQTAIGERLGVEQPSVSRWFTGTDPSGEIHMAIAAWHREVFPERYSKQTSRLENNWGNYPTIFPDEINEEFLTRAISFAAEAINGAAPPPKIAETAMIIAKSAIDLRRSKETHAARVNRIHESLEQALLNVAQQPPLETDPAYARIESAAKHLLGILALAASGDQDHPVSVKTG